MMSYVLRDRALALLALAAVLLWAAPAHAAPVTCHATMTTLAFGAVNPFNSQTDASATLSYTCTNSGNVEHGTDVCFGIGAGPYDAANANPRQVQAGVGQHLQFQLYQDAVRTKIWFQGKDYLSGLRVPMEVPANGSITGSATLYGRVLAGQSTVVPGPYSEILSNNTLDVVDGGNNIPNNCDGGSPGGSSFAPFTVTATVSKSCIVSATTLDLGSVAAVTVNASNSGTISVTCPSGTAYYVGLSPSNNNTAGAGVMAGTGTNTDKVPYQLNSVSAIGPVWGNTATSSSIGNGVAGTGNGVAQPITVYATVPRANFTPDAYTDTVMVNVNY